MVVASGDLETEGDVVEELWAAGSKVVVEAADIARGRLLKSSAILVVIAVGVAELVDMVRAEGV